MRFEVRCGNSLRYNLKIYVFLNNSQSFQFQEYIFTIAKIAKALRKIARLEIINFKQTPTLIFNKKNM